MPWSIPIARVFGIPIRAHVTFLLVVAWGAWSWGSAHGLRGAAFGVAFTLLLFLSVALHELGHSVVAQRRGLEVLEIVLLPIGGVAALDGKPSRPRDELAIALAGPAVNLVIAFGLGAMALALHRTGLLDMSQLREPAPSLASLLGLLTLGNLGLAVFNLLPIFPMDGGRVLRAALASRFGMARGTRWAAGAGQVAAVGMGTFAVLNGAVLLAVIAVLIFFAARRERLDVAAQGSLAGLAAGDVAQVPSLLVEPHELIGSVLRKSLRSSDSVFPVVRDGALVGVVLRDSLVLAARAGLAGAPISTLPFASWSELDVRAASSDVLAAMERDSSPLAVVVEDGVPIGVVTREHLLSRVLATSAALMSHERPLTGRQSAAPE